MVHVEMHQRAMHLPRRTPSVVSAAVLMVGAWSMAACGSGSATTDGATLPGATDATNAKTIAVRGVDDLPDPCALVTRRTVRSLVDGPIDPQRNAPVSESGEPLLFSTCSWGDPDDHLGGAIGVQIGVANAAGHDVVANRSSALDPALASDIGDDGKEAMLLGEMPTGGAAGSSIFFRHRGWSVLIGHVGDAARLRSVEQIALEVIDHLDALPAARH